MFTLVRNAGVQRALRDEAVPLLVAFVTAEFFYRFHSFALECAAFLVTWLAVSWVASAIKARVARAD